MTNDLDAGPASDALSAIRQAGGSRAEQITGGITRADVPQRDMDARLAAFASLAIILNNAGYTWANVMQKTTDEQFQALPDIHITDPFRILRAASGFIREAANR